MTILIGLVAIAAVIFVPPLFGYFAAVVFNDQNRDYANLYEGGVILIVLASIILGAAYGIGTLVQAVL